MSDTTIYAARAIVTMNPSRPLATHLAVREGRIVAVGSEDELAGLRDAKLDERFSSKVLLPGFVEGHAHVLEGKVWSMTYVGFADRRAPDGRLVTGLDSIDAVVERLKAVSDTMTDPEATLMAWGFDPIYFKSRRMNRHDLDSVSTTRPVMVLHASLHISNVNSFLLERAGFDRGTNITGVQKLDDGTPSGELLGIAARLRAFRVVGMQGLTGTIGREEVVRYGQSAMIQGITTIADLHNDLPDDLVELYRELAAGDQLPIRLVPALASVSHTPRDGVEKIKRLIAFNSDRLHFGLVKLIVDGSIQGFTARLTWPGYWNGAPNGLWYIAPEQLGSIIETYHRAGIQLHIHTNGDEATALAIEALEAALTAHPRPDHRHTLQHCQLASAAQFRRMKALGLCVNLFSNHIFYWGDAHYEQTVGPERACRMNAAGTAERQGVPYAIHCDAPVTPLGPLFTAWCAVNRMTSSGRLLGAEERISVQQALAAVTVGAAYTLKLDHLVGSIESGKFADFAVLEENPLEVAPERLKDVAVWGVVTGGRPVEGTPLTPEQSKGAKIPLTVIGGFLGAGKTTLLNNILSRAEGRYAVLVNDFGAVNFDASLVADHDGETLKLTNGCVCCSLGSGLLETLIRVLDAEPPFDHILIEASGVADPWLIAEIALVEPALRLSAVVVLEEAQRLPQLLADSRVGETVASQIRAAELLVLNKADLADRSALDEARAAAVAIKPDIGMLETVNAELPPDLLELEAVPRRGRISRLRADEPPHEQIFRRFLYRRDGAFQRRLLEESLRAIPNSLLRLKGICRMIGEPRPVLLQMVGARFTLSPAPLPAESRPAIELIGIGTDAMPENGELAAVLDVALDREASARNPRGNAE